MAADRYRLLSRRFLLLLLLVLGGCRQRQLTEPTCQTDAPERFWIRVLLNKKITSCVLTPTCSFLASSQQPYSFEAHFPRQKAPLKIRLSGGTIAVGAHRFAGKEVVIAPDEPHVFNLNGSKYRGKLKLIINPDGKTFNAINLVPLEPYLAGVVGAEMPSYWEPAALAAQAIAARTYCLYIKRQFGKSRAWDVTRTQSNQVYLGVAGESSPVWEAVNRTFGRVLVCKGPDGENGIFPAYYSSSCGGHTADSREVFSDSFQALKPVACPFCRNVAKPKDFFWRPVEFDKTELTTRLSNRYPNLKQLGKIVNIVVVGQCNYSCDKWSFSRLTRLKLVGSTGKSEFIRAEDFRLTVDPTGRRIRSTICKIADADDKWTFYSGRGWGHGVGLCQCGAEALARKGKKVEQILSYYYPGSRIMNVYEDVRF